MQHRWISWIVLAGLGGCLDYERMILKLDLRTGRGTLILEDVGTTDPDDAAEDFADLVNDHVLGDAFLKDNPGWRIEKRELYEHRGHLDARMHFSFDDPGSLGLYKHDRRSPYFWCADGGDLLISTNGTVVPDHPDCVVFERRARHVELVVSTGRSPTSLLPQFRAWDGQPVPQP